MTRPDRWVTYRGLRFQLPSWPEPSSIVFFFADGQGTPENVAAARRILDAAYAP